MAEPRFVKVRNLRTGSTTEKTFPNGQKVNDIKLDHAKVQYLYHDDQFYYFMDNETYEQTMLNTKQLGDGVNYMVDGLEIELETYEGEPIAIELPTTVDMEVIDAEPGFAGDTANAPYKGCTVVTGLKGAGPPVCAGGRCRSRQYRDQRLRHPRVAATPVLPHKIFDTHPPVC